MDLKKSASAGGREALGNGARNGAGNGARGGPPAPLSVGFVLLDRFTLNAFSPFIDALRLAADRGGRSRQIHCAWTIMGRNPVAASCGLKVVPDEPLGAPQRFHYIAVCGGNGYLDARPDPQLTSFLREADARGVKLIGVCTGTFEIARAGLMRGHRACVHWNVYDAFREQFPHLDAVPNQIFLDSGTRITCAGSAGVGDFALHLIARHCGPEKAQQAVRHMMLREVRPSTHPQAHFYSDLDGVRDHLVRRAVQLMEQALNEPLTSPQLAAALGVSLRQFERRFHAALGRPPSAYCRDLRLRYAAWLLEHTELPVGAIAGDCGFSDGAHFARLFRAQYACPPSAFRARLRATGGRTDRAQPPSPAAVAAQ